MKTLRGYWLLPALLVLSAMLSVGMRGEAQSLTWLGTLTPTGGSSFAYDVSNDGTTVVGRANGYAVVWNRQTSTITQVYASSYLIAVAADGSKAVGFWDFDPVQRAFMWTPPNNFQWLPPAPSFCWAVDITPSGSHAVGKARSPSGNNLPAVWELNTNPPLVHTYAVPGDMYLGEAYGISDDARTVVAFGHGNRWGYKGVVFRLNSDGSVAAWAFLNPVSGHYGCVPREVSGDGTIAVGNTGNFWGGSYYPVMWREVNNWQPEQLAHLGGNAGEAFDIRGDVIVGFSSLPNRQRRAVRWNVGTATTQVEDLNLTYAALLSNGSRLSIAWGISSNGRFIVGQGYNAATGRDEAFLLDT
ncbi:MAG: hypothetical protein KatS3mg022_3110 [Armatimonadota bacterium]|nr:MAG: hypothetical protein KatS3mg022_3110 [Armatimonadota bacterium]